VGSVIISRSQT